MDFTLPNILGNPIVRPCEATVPVVVSKIAQFVVYCLYS